MIKVSIIITCYNSEKYIERALESVLNQNFPQEQYEIVTVNDGSIDSTSQILKKYKKKYNNRIKIITQTNKGFVSAANIGFKNAQGIYAVKLDSDDVFEPDLLKEETAALDKNSEIDFVYSDYYEKFDSNKKNVKVRAENVFQALAIGMMYRRLKLEKAGFWQEKLMFPEYDLILRTWGEWKGYRINKPLFTYIRRKESVSRKAGWQKKALQQLKILHPDKLQYISLVRKF